MTVKRNNLFNKDKLKYIKGEKPDVKCILCAIADKNKNVSSLEIFRTDNFIISVNLYPYNPGHVLIFPVRHVEEFSTFSDDEALEMHHLTAKTIAILRDEYNPAGYNIGCNIGNGSGASIAHLHQHIVPRYINEAGFIDAIAGTRLFVSDPVKMMKELRKRFINLNK
jgi:ATP adenylyltransferase